MWLSKKQSVVAQSSAEAELKVMVHGICEGMWLRRLLNELGITTMEPISMCWGNQIVIRIARNPVHHDQTKHMESDHHFIKEKLDAKIVDL